MESESFLTIDNQPISLKQSLDYLRSSGKLGAFVGEILRQYSIEKELEQEGIKVDSVATEQAIIDFRLQNQLIEPNSFQEWLTRNGISFETFYKQVASRFQQEKLKVKVAESKLQEYFIERKIFLDRVVLSRIIVENQELAEELYSQILEEGAQFEQLAQEYSMAEDRIANGMMGVVSRGTLPDVLRAAIDSANPGDLLEPLEIDGRWCLFRVEQILPASLDDERLKHTLRDELFERWLAQKIQKLSVKLQVNS